MPEAFGFLLPKNKKRVFLFDSAHDRQGKYFSRHLPGPTVNNMKDNDGRKSHNYGMNCSVFFIFYRFLRGVASREFTQLVHGFLGGKRIPLPACTYHAIRTGLSGEDEEFVDYEDNE